MAEAEVEASEEVERCLREKRARKRRPRGFDSVVSVLRRVVICWVVEFDVDGAGSVAEGDMVPYRLAMKGLLKRTCFKYELCDGMHWEES